MRCVYLEKIKSMNYTESSFFNTVILKFQVEMFARVSVQFVFTVFGKILIIGTLILTSNHT